MQITRRNVPLPEPGGGGPFDAIPEMTASPRKAAIEPVTGLEIQHFTDLMRLKCLSAKVGPPDEREEKFAVSQITKMHKEERAELNRGKGPQRFTTEYAVHYGRAQGWKLVERERYDHLTKRHHDLDCGADAKFETASDFVLIQGAGKSERAAHFARFEARGGVDRCKKGNCRFLYLEFLRGDKTPVRLEWWA